MPLASRVALLCAGGGESEYGAGQEPLRPSHRRTGLGEKPAKN